MNRLRKEFLKEDSWKIFDQIAPNYDLLNRILSFGLDLRWRKHMAKFLPPMENLNLLDLATGTGDVPLILNKRSSKILLSHGIDMSEEMLTLGRKKVTYHGLDGQIILKHGDANRVPYPGDHFHVVTMAFGIRNISDISRVFKEMFRVLKKDGRAIILEFSLPENRMIHHLHLFYLRYCIPSIGYLFSRNYQAYRYLNQTIEKFPYGGKFCSLMSKFGFQNVKANTLLGGVATIYQGDKL